MCAESPWLLGTVDPGPNESLKKPGQRRQGSVTWGKLPEDPEIWALPGLERFSRTRSAAPPNPVQQTE
jgi:hypothetical protein